MTLKLACADFTFPLLPHDKSLDLIAMLGFEGVDIGLFEGRSHLWPSRVFADLKSVGQRAGAQAPRPRARRSPMSSFRPLRISSRSPPTIPMLSIRRQARDWFERTVEFALECGGRHVSALPGVNFEGVPEAESYRALPRRAGLALRDGQRRRGHLLRRGPRRLDRPDARVRRPARAVGPGLTLTLDYTHFTRSGLPDSEVEPLIAHASHFHARGARAGPAPGIVQGKRHRLRTRPRRHAASGLLGYVGVEYVWIDWEHCNEVDNLSETILMRDLLRNNLSRQ